MKPLRLCAFAALAAIGALALAGTMPAAAQAPTPADHVAALKANLATSQKLISQYEWTETTAFSLKGEVKSTTQNRCFYGADGKLQKTPVAPPPPPAEKKRGLKGKIIENKTEEISEYMKGAVALVKSYVPPDPARIQAAKDAKKVAVTPAGSAVQIDISDYEKPGDKLTLKLDAAKDTLLGLTVASWMKDANDKVGLTVRFGSLTDGATYAEEITLSAPSQKIEVTITNSGYKKL
jgi:hypothetical protein